MSNYCFLNRELKLSDEALLMASDLGLQRGYGVFDFARTYNRKLFHFEGHLERLRYSAGSLNIKVPYSNQEITEMANIAIEKSDLSIPGVRLLLTGGYGSTDAGFDHPNFLIIAEEISEFPKKVYDDGVAVMTYQFQRELPRTKSLNYLNALRLEPVKNEKGVFDILYYWTHGVTEFPRGNFFMFKDNILITPKDHVLLGITREVVLQQASEDFSTEEREISLEESELSDEAFITSTSKRIIPIVKIDDKVIGNGEVGQHTKRLMGRFDRYVQSY